MTPEGIEAAAERQAAEGIEPATDPALLHRVAVLLAVWRQRQGGGARAAQ